MNFTSKFFYTGVLLILSTLIASAQPTARTITISGTASHNLSPNEIIIKINYQEYFTDKEEKKEQKVTIEAIEQRILTSLYAAGVNKEKVTMGEINIVRPLKNRKSHEYAKRRINKSLFVCINTTEHFIQLTRQLEQDQLFDDIITAFSIVEFNHTEKAEYLKKSRAQAFADAKNKATLILAESNQKPGKVITIKEINRSTNRFDPNAYSFDNRASETPSGFKPIVVSYQLEVVFEIL